MVVGVTDESNHISYPGLMANVFSDDLVQRVWVCIGVTNKAPVVVVMVPSEPHFRIQSELVTVFLQRLQVVAECVVRTTSLRQDFGEQNVAHANTEKPFDICLGRGRSILPETLKSRQEKYAASGFQHIATFHNNTAISLLLAGGP